MLRTVSAQSKRMCGPDPRRRAQIPPESLGQIALAIGLIEVFSHKGKITPVDMFEDGRKPGEFGFDPLGFAKTPADFKVLQVLKRPLPPFPSPPPARGDGDGCVSCRCLREGEREGGREWRGGKVDALRCHFASGLCKKPDGRLSRGANLRACSSRRSRTAASPCSPSAASSTSSC